MLARHNAAPSVFPRSRPLSTFLLLLAFLAGATACTRADPEPTNADLLAELEGRALTPAEVAQREEIADLLCGLDDEILVRLWAQLKPAQLEFQDFVFVRQCPQRNQLYAEATGRFKVNDPTETTAN